jgi:hypothetical protein
VVVVDLGNRLIYDGASSRVRSWTDRVGLAHALDASCPDVATCIGISHAWELVFAQSFGVGGEAVARLAGTKRKRNHSWGRRGAESEQAPALA